MTMINCLNEDYQDYLSDDNDNDDNADDDDNDETITLPLPHDTDLLWLACETVRVTTEHQREHQ